jgi:hypothetical protein
MPLPHRTVNKKGLTFGGQTFDGGMILDHIRQQVSVQPGGWIAVVAVVGCFS